MEKAKIIYNGNVNLERVNVDSGFNFFDESPMQRILQESVKRIREKQDEVLQEALKIHVSEKVDLLKECRRMFPRIKCVSQENNTLYFWDNGTPEGQLLVTFYQGDMFKGFDVKETGNCMIKTGVEYVIAPKT